MEALALMATLVLLAVTHIQSGRISKLHRRLVEMEDRYDGLGPILATQAKINDTIDERLEENRQSIGVVVNEHSGTRLVTLNNEVRLRALEAKRWLDPDGNVRSAGQ